MRIEERGSEEDGRKVTYKKNDWDRMKGVSPIKELVRKNFARVVVSDGF